MLEEDKEWTSGTVRKTNQHVKEQLFLSDSIQVRFLYHLLSKQQGFSMKFIIVVTHSFIHTYTIHLIEISSAGFSTISQVWVTQREVNRSISIRRWKEDFLKLNPGHGHG